MPFGVAVPPLGIPRRRLTVLDPAYTGFGPPVAPEVARPGLMDNEQPTTDTVEKSDPFSTFLKLAAPILGLAIGGKKGLAYGTQFGVGMMGEEERQRQEKERMAKLQSEEEDRKKRFGLLEAENTRQAEDALRKKEKDVEDKAQREYEKLTRSYSAAIAAQNWDEVERLGKVIWGQDGHGTAEAEKYGIYLDNLKIEQDWKRAQAEDKRELNRNPPKPVEDRIIRQTEQRIDPRTNQVVVTTVPYLYDEKTQTMRRIKEDTTAVPTGVGRPAPTQPAPAGTAVSRPGLVPPPTQTPPPTLNPATEALLKQGGIKPDKPFNEKSAISEITSKSGWTSRDVEAAIVDAMNNGMSREDAIRYIANFHKVLLSQ